MLRREDMGLIAKRPLDWDAAAAADEAIYAAHPGHPSLFDEEGNRIKLKPGDPLCSEWMELYASAGGEVEDPDAPPDTPPDVPIQPCPLQDEIRLVGLWETFAVGATIFDEGERHWKMADAPRRQYVNRQRTDAQQGREATRFEFGRILELRAEVVWKSGGGASRAGAELLFEIVPHVNNRQDLPEPMRHGAVTGVSTIAITDEDGWTSSVTLSLSSYGGDQFRIRATLLGDPSQSIESGIYTVWRLVDLEPRYMSVEGSPIVQDPRGPIFRACFEKVFIEHRDMGHGALVPFRWVVDAISAQSLLAEAGASLPNTPPTIGLFYVNLLGDTPEGGPTLIRRSRWLSKHDEVVLWATKIELGRVEHASWKHAFGSWASLPLERLGVHATGYIRLNVIKVDMRGVPGVDPDRAVKVRLFIRLFDSLRGISPNNSLWDLVATRTPVNDVEGGDRTSAGMEMTSMHEIGHTYGVPAATTPEGDPNPHKVDAHCFYGDKQCLMYTSAAYSLSFCPACSDMLRARDLRSLPRSGEDGFA